MANNNSALPVNGSLSATLSRCITQCVTGTHYFQVTNFSLLDGMGIDKYVSSSTFSVGGCNWRVDFHPDGDEPEATYMSVFLRLVGGPAGVKVKYVFSLFDQDYQVSTTTGKRKRREEDEESLLAMVEMTTFEKVGEAWGCNPFIQKSVLEDLLYFCDDCFTIRCDLCAITFPTEDADTIGVPQANLHQDLARMLKDGEGTDVTFRVGDQLFHAHRNILAARSMVFKAELFGPMKERDAGCIEIDEMEPAAIEGLLHFIYTDLLPDNWNTTDKATVMQHLLVAADRYGLDRLKVM